MLSVSSRPINPICILSGGKRDKKYVNIDTEINNDSVEEKISDLISNSDLNKNQLIKLKESIDKGEQPIDEDIVDMYNKIIGIIGNEVILNKGEKLEVYPDIKKERTIIMCAGPQGSGKSHFCSQFIKHYIKEFPKNKIFVFSNVDKDEAYDKYGKKKIRRVIIDSDLITNPINVLEELQDSLCIFDDICSISNKQMRECVQQLRDSVLSIGRHSNTSILMCEHQLMNYSHTKVMLMESDKVVVYPKSGMGHAIKRFCRDYVSMSKKDIDKLFTLNSRWVCIKKSYPQMIIHENGCYITTGN